MCVNSLKDNALIRELHVYGQIIPTQVGNRDSSNASQHHGIGKRLLKEAEEISIKNNFKKIAIRSGVGVRNYYRKRGYTLVNEYMVRELDSSDNVWYNVKLIIIFYILYILFRVIYNNMT